MIFVINFGKRWIEAFILILTLTVDNNLSFQFEHFTDDKHSCCTCWYEMITAYQKLLHTNIHTHNRGRLNSNVPARKIVTKILKEISIKVLHVYPFSKLLNRFMLSVHFKYFFLIYQTNIIIDGKDRNAICTDIVKIQLMFILVSSLEICSTSGTIVSKNRKI